MRLPSLPNLLLSCAAVGALSAGVSACSSPEPTTAPSAVDTDVSARAADILSLMSVEEKVGQVIQADIAFVTPEQVRDYNLGSVLNGGNSAPGGGKVATPQAWIDLADAFWTASTDTSDGGVGVPAIWGTDAVHGHNNLAEATIFPHNSALGAADNPELMRRIGDVTAREIRATGLDWTFAPTLAVARDDRWGRAYESYSENPALVASYAAPLIEGLQGSLDGDGFLIGDNVMATAKHFIGDGGTQFGLDKGDTVGTPDEVMAIHGAGYGPAIDAGVQAIMASFSSVNGEKMHGSKRLLTDVLRGEMGFTGLVVGDWNGHAEIPGCTATDCPDALMAGIDLYMAPESWQGLYDSLLLQVNSGEVPMTRLNEAVSRVLEVKIRSGLLDTGLPSARATSDISVLGRADHRAVARDAVRQSLVLLKNENALLPLNPSSRVLVTGSGADSMQQQTGGWTLDWQGTDNANDEFATGQTVFAGLRDALDGEVELSTNGRFDEQPDVAIVVFGEQPYAEYKGDMADLVYEFDNGENLALLRDLKAQNIPTISVFLTGRPLFANAHINASDAFVVAWLPGTEGGGVADVLVGNAQGAARHDFTGRLPFTWPDNGAGEPLNTPDVGAGDPGVLFEYGFGLSYADDGALAALSEDPGVAATRDFNGAIVDRGGAGDGIALFVGDSSNLRQPITGMSGSSLGGVVSVKGVDYKAQEDARQFSWNGQGQGQVDFVSGRAIDLSERADQAIVMELRVDALEGPLELAMGCGEGCGGSLDIAPALGEAELGEWTRLAVPLSCFATQGMSIDTVEKALSLRSASASAITLHSAEIAQSADTLTCPS